MRRELEKLQFFSLNTRGLGDEKIEELLRAMRKKNIFAFAIQETWRLGQDEFVKDGFRILTNNRSAGRKRGGVAIVLSPAAVAAWKLGGSVVNCFGDRVISIKLRLADAFRKPIDVIFASAYAPVSNACRSVKDEYHNNLQFCVDHCGNDDILILGTYANASMGTRSCKDDKVLGPFGISKTNLNGVLFRDLCSVLGLCLATTFFKKRSYGTWRHPRSKLLYQLNHFLVQRASLVRIIDAGRYGENLLDSDHDAIRIVIRVAKNLKKNSGMAQNFIDRCLLSCPNMKGEFVSAVFESDGLLPDRLIHAAKKTLNVRSRKNLGWFNENAELLHAAIDARNLAQDVFSRSCRPGTRGDAAVHKKLREARKLVKTLVSEAKAEWRSKRISLLGLSRAAPKEYCP